jgi:hypothetical protein
VQRSEGQDLAGKILHPSQQADEKAQARFAGEAELLAALRHPNVVSVHGLEEIEGERVLLMELVDGMSLAAAIAIDAPFPEHRITTIGRGIAAGLAAAHRAGLVHRDLKPDNVLLTDRGEPKLVDFGMARATSFAGVDPGAFAIVGTPDYMAPETIDPLAVDTRSDLYSLGCILFEMATGAPPYRGATAFAILEAHRTAEIPELPESSCSPELAALIRGLMAKSPADRPQSATAVRDALAQMGGAGALAPAGAYSVVRAGECASCGAPAVPGVSVCFGCGLVQVRLERGRYTVFVTGPGKTTHKLGPDLRDRLLEWLEANPSMGLDPKPIAIRLPRLPFVLVTGVSRSSASSMVASVEELGLEAEAVRGGRFALPSMRKKSWQLGARMALIGATGLWYGLQSVMGPLLLPTLGLGLAASVAAGWAVGGRGATRRTGRTVSALPEVISAPIERIVEAVPHIREKRHRESLRAVVQRALAVRDHVPAKQQTDVDADLGRALDLALVAAMRVDQLETELTEQDMRDASAATRSQMLERDSWAARLLEMTAFLDALQARYAAAASAPESETRAELEQLRAHIEALEEVQAL